MEKITTNEYGQENKERDFFNFSGSEIVFQKGNDLKQESSGLFSFFVKFFKSIFKTEELPEEESTEVKEKTKEFAQKSETVLESFNRHYEAVVKYFLKMTKEIVEGSKIKILEQGGDLTIYEAKYLELANRSNFVTVDNYQDLLDDLEDLRCELTGKERGLKVVIEGSFERDDSEKREAA